MRIRGIQIIRRKDDGRVLGVIGLMSGKVLGDNGQVVATYEGPQIHGGEEAENTSASLLAQAMFLAGVKWARENPNQPVSE